MTTVSMFDFIYDSEFNTIDELITKLQEMRSKADNVSIELDGCDNFGYKIRCRWTRPMTEEELKRHEISKKISEDMAKERRRKEYERLKAEFDGK